MTSNQPTDDSLANELHLEAIRLLDAVGSPHHLLADQPAGLDDTWRRIVDAGWLRILVPEEDEGVNPLGMKGIGEIGVVGMNAAIANAVYHATGRRIRDLPIRIEDLL